jgi:K+-transporting ATPase ATPase C chain
MKSNKKWGVYRPVILLSLLSMLVCGLAYPVAITGISQAVFPSQANGSLVQLGNRTVGSTYIDNGFTLPIFFHARNESNPQTASASGVDPDITLSDAISQIPSIHNATGIPSGDIQSIVTAHVQRTLFFVEDPYVNVLQLNLALISAYPSVYSGYG